MVQVAVLDHLVEVPLLLSEGYLRHGIVYAQPNLFLAVGVSAPQSALQLQQGWRGEKDGLVITKWSTSYTNK